MAKDKKTLRDARSLSCIAPRTKVRRAGRGWTVAILVCGFIAFSSALFAPFVFDDIPAIDRNQSIRQLFSVSIFSPPRDTPVAGRPLVNATLAINHAINEALGIE